MGCCLHLVSGCRQQYDDQNGHITLHRGSGSLVRVAFDCKFAISFLAQTYHE